MRREYHILFLLHLGLPHATTMRSPQERWRRAYVRFSDLEWRLCGKAEGPQRVGQSQPRLGAKRLHYDPQQPFTPRWLPCVLQRSLDQIASMPATGQ